MGMDAYSKPAYYGQDTSPLTLQCIDYDTLSTIVSYLSTRDALNLSVTAQSLHFVSKKQALSSIHIRKSRRLSRVSQYLLADVAGRLHWLRELVVDIPVEDVQYSSDATYDLAALLDRAGGLRAVSLYNVSTWSNPRRLCDALASNSHLAELRLSNATEMSLSSLRSLRNSLRLLSFTADPGQVRLDDLISSLQHLCNIHTLKLQDLVYSSNADSSKQVIQLHSVRHLDISETYSVSRPTRTSVPVSALSTAFPNIRQLSLTDIDLTSASHDTHWRHLDTVTGDARSFQSLTRCSARQLHLVPPKTMYLNMVYCARDEATRNVMVEEEARATLAAVQSLSPVMLSFCVNNKMDAHFWTELVRNSPRLRYLVVQLRDALAEFLPDISSWMKTVLPILASSKLFYIQLKIAPIDDVIYLAPNTVPPAFDELYEHYPLSLVRHVPSLAHVALDFNSSDVDVREDQQRNVLWWIASGPGKCRTVTAVPAEIGQRALSAALCSLN